MYYWSGKNSIYYDASTGIMAQYEGEGEVDFMMVEVVDDALHMRWINYDGEIECSGSGDLKKLSRVCMPRTSPSAQATAKCTRVALTASSRSGSTSL